MHQLKESSQNNRQSKIKNLQGRIQTGENQLESRSDRLKGEEEKNCQEEGRRIFPIIPPYTALCFLCDLFGLALPPAISPPIPPSDLAHAPPPGESGLLDASLSSPPPIGNTPTRGGGIVGVVAKGPVGGASGREGGVSGIASSNRSGGKGGATTRMGGARNGSRSSSMLDLNEKIQ